MKYYNFETISVGVKNGLRKFLKKSSIRYELSGCDDGWHFEILCTEEEAEKVNKCIEKNTWHKEHKTP